MIAPVSRSRLVYALLIAVVIALGLASRTSSIQSSLPALLSDYAGDTLWALTAFLGLGFLLPKLSTWRVAALAFSFAVLIECSQLYHAPWLDRIRHTRLGALLLGFGFLWSDLFATQSASPAAWLWNCGSDAKKRCTEKLNAAPAKHHRASA